MFDRTEYLREYHRKNKEKDNEKNRNNYHKRGREYHNNRIRQYRQSLKWKVLSHYTGGTLVCRCGFSDKRALCIDHINNNGGAERKKIGIGEAMYRHIINNNYPNDYQVICANCNMIKETERRKKALSS